MYGIVCLSVAYTTAAKAKHGGRKPTSRVTLGKRTKTTFYREFGIRCFKYHLGSKGRMANLAEYGGYQQYRMNNLHVVDIPNWDSAIRFSETPPEKRPVPTGQEGRFLGGIDQDGYELRLQHLCVRRETRKWYRNEWASNPERYKNDGRNIDGVWYRWNTRLQNLLDNQSGFVADIQRMVDAIEKIAPVPAYTRKRKKVRGKQGSLYNIHAANMGRHNRAWSRTTKIPSNRKGAPKHVHLISNPSGNNAAGENAKWMGAAAYVLMRHFEAKNVKVTLSMCDGVRMSGTSSCLVAIRAKSPGTKISLNSIAKFFNFQICSKLVYAFDIEIHGRQNTYQDHQVHDCPEMQKYLQDKTPGAKVVTVPKLSSLQTAVRWIQERKEELQV